MKKNLFMVAAVALMAIVSCNKEEINNGGFEPQEPQTPSVTVEFTASLDTEETKTTLDAVNKKTLWLDSDEISINNVKFAIKEIQDDGKAIFVNADPLPEDFSAPFNAVYPYGSDGVPATQTAYAGNFDPKAVIETATSEDYSLKFKNETSLLKFQVPAACNSVTLSATEDLAKDSNTVTISGDFVADTDYYVAVLPGVKTNFEVNLYGKVARSAPSVEISSSSIVNMGKIPTPELKLYVEDDTDYSALYLYMYDASGDNTWPGNQITATETVNGVLYKVYTVPADRIGKEYTYIFNNNNGAQVEENKKISFNKDNYLRVTKKYSEVVDASNTGKEDPLTLYIRNDKNWTKLNYYMWVPNGSNNQAWPGKAADTTKKTKIENNYYVYVELGLSYSWKMVIINNGSAQTDDLTIPDTNDDIYVSNNGYIWKGADQKL